MHVLRRLASSAAVDTVKLAVDPIGQLAKDVVARRVQVHAKPALVVMHGLYGRGRNLRAVSDKIAERLPDHPVFTVDMRNHGDSPHSPVHTYPAMAEDIVRMLDDHSIASCIPVGHSMGGKAAMTLCLGHADRIAKAVIVDIAPSAYSPHRDSFQVAPTLQALPLHAITSLHDADHYLHDHIPDINIRRFLLQNLIIHRGVTPSWRFNLAAIANAVQHDLTSYEPMGYDAYTKPVLFLRGSLSDYLVPAVHGEMIARLFPKAQIHTIEGSNHWIHFDNPAKFVEEVVTFVARPDYSA